MPFVQTAKLEQVRQPRLDEVRFLFQFASSRFQRRLGPLYRTAG
jgi:hypothetical protein